MWSVSIIMTVFFHQARDDDELKESIRANIVLVPQFQILSYSAYLGIFLCAWFFNYILVERKTAIKPQITKHDLFMYGAHSIITFMTAYVDLIMFTIIALTFFNVAYELGNESAIVIIHLSDMFYIFIFPPLALWTVYRLRKKK